jgi:hypothetical protein
MPELSRFFGIVIAMYYDNHEPPHFQTLQHRYRVLVPCVRKTFGTCASMGEPVGRLEAKHFWTVWRLWLVAS